MRIEIRYATQFVYPEPVRESHNVLRACPAPTARQILVSYDVRTRPVSRILSYVDYWGTRVDAFSVRRAHERLDVIAEATVETSARPNPEPRAGLEAYGEDEVVLGLHAFLQPSPHVRWDGRLAEAARTAVARATSAVDAVAAICDAVASHLEYAPGSTYVGMDVNDVWERGRGVCQDFAHAAIALYRAAGIPARYVSGYLYAADQSVGLPPEEAEIEIATHAWVEAFVPGWGWWELDPTNPTPVGELHVKIGHGRDYDDVMPLRGVYHGPREHALGVSVTMSREHLSQAQEQ
jgi:transglutaminase-like putative cysteine protease